MAVVTPIPKEGDHEKANNNRPISLLPILSKVCEGTVLNQMIPYLDSNQRLSANQSDNKRFHSTETSLIETTDAILNAIDDKKLTAVVVLDLSKAFDSIDHKILLLQGIGLSSAASSYRIFKLSIGQVSSSANKYQPIRKATYEQWCTTRYSILGPILFNIYTLTTYTNSSSKL